MIKYNPKLKTYARKLRTHGTLAEVLLWNQIKGQKNKGYLFYRQKPIDEYIVDFYCHKLKLIIEIDGITHDYKQADDLHRQKKLESLGYSFLRFTDDEVTENLDGILAIIHNWISKFKKKQKEINSL